ncbi:Ig-like domain (group 3) [Actinacidiphila yanglinensis]|uniref:Ig-like domain (Group 3) n=1 Tax=Actinacidiphila yanglinensis TaxID=310779 RepID=A0A1H6ED67_9ACTN|nr:Ig-like domain-containing protein [Actinacidiphila yanglinensis]SEG94824.1 Ig-like domain (group 3) [Actinacidiphila yanglinensis]
MISWRERRVRPERRSPKAAFLVAAAAAAAVVALAPSAAAVDTSTTTVEASPSPATTGQLVVLDATVTCTSDPSTGLGVSFFDGDNLLATAPVSTDGQSFLTTGFTTTGTHHIIAAYNGDANCGASNDDTDITVTQATTPTPPPNNPGCLLCGLINYHVGDIHNEININSHNTTNIVKPSSRW